MLANTKIFVMLAILDNKYSANNKIEIKNILNEVGEDFVMFTMSFLVNFVVLLESTFHRLKNHQTGINIVA